MRISSEMFPFASHGELGYDLSYAKDELKVCRSLMLPLVLCVLKPPRLQAVGDLARKLGHRLTTHPGQFTQLASPKEAVVEASIRELECMLFYHPPHHKSHLPCI